MSIVNPFSPSTIINLASELKKLVANPYMRSQVGNSYKYSSSPIGSNPYGTSSHRSSPGISSYLPTRNQIGATAQKYAFGNAFNDILGLSSQLGQALNQNTDPMTQLYNSLLDQLQSPIPQPTGINTTDLMNQVKSAINPIYDQRVQAAQNQTKQQQGDVTNMYAALKQDYKDIAPQVAAQNAAAQKQIEDLYGQLRSNLTGNYSRVSQDQAELFKQLGIESALPSVLDQQAPALTDALTSASQNQASEQQNYIDQGNANQTYYAEQQPIATMQGIEVNNNLGSQLTNYLNQINAERASGIQSAYLDQLGQAQNQLAQQQSAAQSEQARRQGMLWDILQAQLSAQSKANSTALTPDTYLGSLSPQAQQSVAGAFTQLQRSPEAIYGKTEDPRNPVPGTYVNTTPEWYYAQADQMYNNGQIDAATHQQLLEYLQLYFGNK